MVTLGAVVADPSASTSIAWAQTSVPAVSIAGADTAGATFIAPRVAADTELRFRFTGSDGRDGAVTITNTGAGGTASQATRVGAAATDATLRRFLVGPIGCEITGVDTTPDGRTLFVGIQHPGEDGSANAPDSLGRIARRAAAAEPRGRARRSWAITKDDGGMVAL